jgi:hypothetical protein
VKLCVFGDEEYHSASQVNFLVATSILVTLCTSARVIFFDIKKHRLPSMNALIVFDAMFLIFTFAAAVAVALSPAGDDICTAGNELKTILQEACSFSCSNVVASAVTMFFTFVCFLVSILFTTKVIQTSGALPAAQDVSFGKTGTPRNRKLEAQNNTTIGQV